MCGKAAGRGVQPVAPPSNRINFPSGAMYPAVVLPRAESSRSRQDLLSPPRSSESTCRKPTDDRVQTFASEFSMPVLNQYTCGGLRRRVLREPTERLAYVGSPLRRRTVVAVLTHQKLLPLSQVLETERPLRLHALPFPGRDNASAGLF